MKEIALLSGASGSGISSARYVFEELGYYVIENIPFELTPDLLKVLKERKENKIALIASDVREAKRIINIVKLDKEYKLRFVLLTCDEDELLKRFALTRHVHVRTINSNISLEKAIKLDIQEVVSLIDEADICIDTSNLTVKKLRLEIYSQLEHIDEEKIMHVTFISYGLKNGAPQGLDLSIDVRSLPNPYWVEELKELTGLDQPVIDYLESFDVTHTFLKKTIDYISYCLEIIKEQHRANYNIGIACSGGQHRSTYVANYLANYFSKQFVTSTIHRDTPELNER